jgi:thioredoxin 1
MSKTHTAIVPLTFASYDREVLEESRTVLVDISTPWCPPCRMMSPIVEELAAEFGEKLKVCAVDLDQEFELGRKLNISAVPTFLIYRSGELIERFQGAVSKRLLIQKLGLG